LFITCHYAKYHKSLFIIILILIHESKLKCQDGEVSSGMTYRLS